jgi:hypothetical protein
MLEQKLPSVKIIRCSKISDGRTLSGGIRRYPLRFPELQACHTSIATMIKAVLVAVRFRVNSARSMFRLPTDIARSHRHAAATNIR